MGNTIWAGLVFWAVTSVVTLNITAYTDACGMPPWGITASGAKTEHGIVAAPRQVPFGSRVYIEGYGEGVVEDRGGDIRLTRGRPQHANMDVWMASRQEALDWGRREVVVYTLLWRWPE